MDIVKKIGVGNSIPNTAPPVKKSSGLQIIDPSKIKPIKQPIAQELNKKRFPKELIPTQKTMFVFEILFLLILITGFTNIPMDSIFSGNLDFEISIGWPLPFFELSMAPDEIQEDLSIIRWGGLILDSLVYLIIGYAIDIMINVSWDKTFNKKKKKKKPGEKKPEKAIFHSLYLRFFPEKKPNITNKDVL